MNFLYNIYFTLPNFARIGLPGKIINAIMLMTLKVILDLLMPSYYKRTMCKQGLGVNKDKREETYIVSLTSIPSRINDIWITIETILRQSFKPDKIILWLAEEQFPDRKLPDSLIRLQERGLTIDFCEDLRSHKKYYYSLIGFPESNVITFDDDLYFPKDLLKNVVELHNAFPDMIATNRAHKITVRKGKINPYRRWKHDVTDTTPSHLLVATGGAGTLYPPGAFQEETFNQELIKKLCFYADDLWLKMMELLNDRMVVTNKRYNKDLPSVGSTQNQKLVSFNVLSGGNDIQFNNLLSHFRFDLVKNLR